MTGTASSKKSYHLDAELVTKTNIECPIFGAILVSTALEIGLISHPMQFIVPMKELYITAFFHTLHTH